MSVKDLIVETGLSKSAAYNAVSKGLLPVPVYRFGGKYFVSRVAWQEMKSRQTDEGVTNPPKESTNIEDEQEEAE